MKTLIPALAAAALLAGCSFHARSPEDYREVTRQVLETKKPDIRACYDEQLAQDPQAGGTVVVSFNVEAETGRIVGAKVDEGASTASPALGQCVVRSIAGLSIDPPDAREGIASFTWEFQGGQAGQAG